MIECNAPRNVRLRLTPASWRHVVPSALLLSLAACYHWRPAPVASIADATADDRALVRLRLATPRTVTLRAAAPGLLLARETLELGEVATIWGRVERRDADSIRIAVRGARDARGAAIAVRVQATATLGQDEITGLEHRQLQRRRSAVALAAGALGALAAVIAVALLSY